jgi:hypothetical protein
MICEFCEKTFSNNQNCIRHIKICKKNTSLVSNTEILLKDQKIEFLEQQLKDKEKQIETLIQTLLTSQKSTSVQKLSHKNEEPDKAVEPKYKTPIDKYINVDCKEAWTYQELILFAKENFTLDDFKSVVMVKFEKKYIIMLKKLMEKIPKKNMPIQIKSNKLNNEEGYIKTGDEFERYFRAELFDKLKYLIFGNGTKNLSNILQCLLSDYMETSECQLTETEDKYARMGILGYEDNDNDSDIDKFPKKLLTLQRNLLDLFMVNI